MELMDRLMVHDLYDLLHHEEQVQPDPYPRNLKQLVDRRDAQW